jgi:Ca2+-binding RTX toxin-like protein
MATKTLTAGNDSYAVTVVSSGVYGTFGGLQELLANGTVVDAGAGVDTLVSDQYYSSAFTLAESASGVISFTAASGGGTSSFTHFEKVLFANGVTLNLGTAGNDIIVGTAYNDKVLMGLAGNDSINGGIGADRMSGGTGNDTYFVDNPGDVVVEFAGQGTDTVNSSIAYTLGATVENLNLTGKAVISGTGNSLNNVIVGNSAANKLFGGAGNDTITGGAGKDVMSGGVGADTFIFKLKTDTTVSALTRDAITDFQHLTDHVNLAGIDANIKIAGDQAFTMLAAKGAAFTGVAGQLHYFASGANTVIEGDMNGDKIADFQIQLNGNIALTKADFIL